MSDVGKPPDERSGEGRDEANFKRAAEGSPGEGQYVSEGEQQRGDESWTESEVHASEPSIRSTSHAAGPPQGERGRRRRAPSFFWPIVLIGAGVLLLLSNLGYISPTSWSVLLRLWPVLLVALGIDLLLGRRSIGGAIISGLLILILLGGAVAIGVLAPQIPAFRELAQPVEWHVERIEYPVSGLERARILVDWSSVPGTLRALEDSTNLIEGEIAYRGELIFDVQVRGAEADVEIDQRFSGVWLGPLDTLHGGEQRWLVKVSPDVDLELTLNGGSGRCEVDLRGLQVTGLDLDVGSGAIDLYLPGERTFDAVIEGGSGPLAIYVPEEIGVRVVLESGSGSFYPEARFVLVSGERDGDGAWETGNWRTADERIELRIDQGSGPITIR